VSKSTTQILILPGETGWEIWSRPGEGAFELQRATDHTLLGDLEGIPAGELTLFFALRSVTTVPMRVTTADEEMFEDLAVLHAERLGLRADPLAGQLNDVFEIERERDGAILLSVWLKAPKEGELPLVSPGAFDVSARAIIPEGDSIAVWRELGRWVFAIYRGGKLLYAQATASDSDNPDAAVARELKLALMQLSMQGLEPRPWRITVWSDNPALNLSGLRNAFELPVEIHPRPAPVLPKPLSKLLPEDVRAARKEAQRKQQVRLTVGVVAAAYLLFVGWMGYGLWKDGREVAKLENMVEMGAPEAAQYELHMERWHELADAIDIDHAPVEILHRVAECIPKNAGVRLTTADISPYDVNIQGEAPSNEAANQFRLKLRKSTSLSRYAPWSLPDPRPSTRGFEFQYRGSSNSAQQTP